jgi:hypothetical protein
MHNKDSKTGKLQFEIYKLRGPSLRANYTDRATTSCRRSYCLLLRIESVAWLAQLIPTAVLYIFYTGAATFSFK